MKREIDRRDAIKRVALCLGAAVSASGLASVYGQGSARASGERSPLYLGSGQFTLVSALAERILPRTDTPGAVDVGVPAFVDVSFGKYMTEAERGVFVEGLSLAERRSQALFQRDFAVLGSDEQDRVLAEAATSASGTEFAFWRQLRELVLLGYFTSEKVGRDVLAYDPIPGTYRGCFEIDADHAAWTYM